MELISVRGLSHWYGATRALDGVEMTVGEGETVCIAGPNGAGKTTLLRAVVGLLAPTEGAVLCAGADVERDPAAQRSVGYVPQTPFLYDYLTAWEHVDFIARMRGLGDVHPEERLTAAGLAGRADALVREYSGGMRQRLALLLAELHDPPVLVLDEPFNSLDPNGAAQLAETIRDRRATGRSTVVATHLLGVMSGLATRLVVLGAGRKLADREVPAAMSLEDAYASVVNDATAAE